MYVCMINVCTPAASCSDFWEKEKGNRAGYVDACPVKTFQQSAFQAPQRQWFNPERFVPWGFLPQISLSFIHPYQNKLPKTCHVFTLQFWI